MLVILDPSLRSYNGHFLTYDQSIADVVERGGEPCIVFAAKDIERGKIGNLRIVPCFRYGLEEDLDGQTVATAFLSDLMTAAGSLSIPPGSTLFLHTTTHRQIEPAV